MGKDLQFYFHRKRERGPNPKKMCFFSERDIYSWSDGNEDIPSGTFSRRELAEEIIKLADAENIPDDTFDTIQMLAGIARDLEKDGYVTIRYV